jgi:hypothetical protein
MARTREKRELRIGDAGKRAAEHKTFSRPALAIPEGMGLFNPRKEGVYELDILPYVIGERQLKFNKDTNWHEPGTAHYERTYFAHVGVGPNNDMIVCPNKTFNKRCPICDYRNQIGKDPKNGDAAKALKPKERQLFLIRDRLDRNKGIQLWEISYFLFGINLDRKIHNAPAEKKARYRQFFRPVDGAYLRLVATEKTAGGGRPFLEFTIDDMMRRKEDLTDELAHHGICLDDIPVELSYKELSALFFQEDEDEEKTEADETEEAEEDQDAGGPSDNGRTRQAAEAEDEFDLPEVGDRVEFTYKGRVRQGEVVRVNHKKGLVYVEAEGREEPYAVAAEDIEILDEEAEDLDDEEQEEEEAEDGEEDLEEEDQEDDDGEDPFEDEDEAPPAKKKAPAKAPPPKRHSGARPGRSD